MKKNSYFSMISTIIVLTCMVPQIAMAAWWNPFTWGNSLESETKTQALENRVKELENMLGSLSSTTVSQNLENATTDSTSEAPKVARASWWNPFSWSIFNGTDTKTQILENKMKEMERKLENLTTSTDAPATTTQSQPKTTAKPPQTAPSSKIESEPQSQILKIVDHSNDAVINKDSIAQVATFASDQIKFFNKEVADSKSRASKNLSEMAEYPNDYKLQQAGQDFLNNSAKTDYLGNKMVEVYTKLLNKIQPYLTSSTVLYVSDVNPIVDEMKMYYAEYDASIVRWKASLSNYLIAYANALDNETARLKGLINQTSQGDPNSYSSQSSNKQILLNAVNQKIADLNAKYNQDIKDIDARNAGSGVPTAISNGQKYEVYRVYIDTYNVLQAEYQQILYSN